MTLEATSVEATAVLCPQCNAAPQPEPMGGVCARCEQENVRRFQEPRRAPVYPLAPPAPAPSRRTIVALAVALALTVGSCVGWMAHDLAQWAAPPIAIWRAKEQGR